MLKQTSILMQLCSNGAGSALHHYDRVFCLGMRAAMREHRSRHPRQTQPAQAGSCQSLNSGTSRQTRATSRLTGATDESSPAREGSKNEQRTTARGVAAHPIQGGVPGRPGHRLKPSPADHPTAAPSQEPAVPQGWTDADSDAARLALNSNALLLDTENLSAWSVSGGRSATRLLNCMAASRHPRRPIARSFKGQHATSGEKEALDESPNDCRARCPHPQAHRTDTTKVRRG